MNNGDALWTPARLAFTIVVLSLFAAFGVSSCSSGDEPRPQPPGPSVTTSTPVPAPRSAVPAPSPPALVTTLPPSVLNAEMPALTGAPIKLSNYEGKVLLLNLWATWCGPCRLETPEL
ncbi:MAG TPA: TlpA disulfide reductase family protein, partial [Pyrinomonadaceae bacterium]|nr:TlpA disulfide reductase family protein [Pyrinomonadaceae bacterium]